MSIATSFPVQRKQAKYQGILYSLKTCGKCGKWGILGKHFHKCKANNDGHQHWCASCMVKAQRKHLGYGSMVN